MADRQKIFTKQVKVDKRPLRNRCKLLGQLYFRPEAEEICQIWEVWIPLFFRLYSPNRTDVSLLVLNFHCKKNKDIVNIQRDFYQFDTF